MTRLLGIDPGGSHTGVTLIDLAADKCAGKVLDRESGQPLHEYATAVAREVSSYATGAYALAEGMGAEGVSLVGIEGLNRVTPQMGSKPIDLFPTVEAGVVLGTCLGMLRGLGVTTVYVPPGGHGSSPLRAYPPGLIGAREKKGTGKLRHARSAYDIALAARSLVRMGMA